jgi:hypothetical protein
MMLMRAMIPKQTDYADVPCCEPGVLEAAYFCVSLEMIYDTPCLSSTIFVPSHRALSVNSAHSSLMSIFYRRESARKKKDIPLADFHMEKKSILRTAALKCGCEVMLRHAASTSTLSSRCSVEGNVASLHIIIGALPSPDRALCIVGVGADLLPELAPEVLPFDDDADGEPVDAAGGEGAKIEDPERLTNCSSSCFVFGHDSAEWFSLAGDDLFETAAGELRA